MLLCVTLNVVMRDASYVAGDADLREQNFEGRGEIIA